MTLAELELPHWNAVQQRDRLLGTSLTGVKDAFALASEIEKALDHSKNASRAYIILLT